MHNLRKRIKVLKIFIVLIPSPISINLNKFFIFQKFYIKKDDKKCLLEVLNIQLYIMEKAH